jgi:hypothetical protein
MARQRSTLSLGRTVRQVLPTHFVLLRPLGFCCSPPDTPCQYVYYVDTLYEPPHIPYVYTRIAIYTLLQLLTCCALVQECVYGSTRIHIWDMWRFMCVRSIRIDMAYRLEYRS